MHRTRDCTLSSSSTYSLSLPSMSSRKSASGWPITICLRERLVVMLANITSKINYCLHPCNTARYERPSFLVLEESCSNKRTWYRVESPILQSSSSVPLLRPLDIYLSSCQKTSKDMAPDSVWLSWSTGQARYMTFLYSSYLVKREERRLK